MTGAARIARAVSAGELDPVEVVSGALAALEARPQLNAVITVCAEQALDRARRGVDGRLAGVPLLVKDIIDTAGVRTTIGSAIHAGRVPERSAPSVLALEAEGAIVVGKGACDEFAWGVTGQNAHYGDVGNPRLPGRIAGGSSAGNAAALAAGLCPLALGTDTGGSVRLPAACCGVVGMKPPVGTVTTEGVFPLSPSYDTVGPMARTVEDCALAYAVLRRGDPPAPRTEGLTVGVLTARPRLGPDEPAAERDDRALAFAERLEALGAGTVEVELPVPEVDIWPVFYAEAAAVHAATFPSRRDEYGPTPRAKLDLAARVDPDAVASGRGALAEWRARAAAELSVDVVVSPTLGLAEVPRAGVDELEIRVPFSAYARAFSFLGWPAIAVGGVHLAGRDDTLVLGAALAWERAYGPP